MKSVDGRKEGEGVEGTGEGTSGDLEEEGEGERSSLAEAAIEGSSKSELAEEDTPWSSGRR